MSSVLPQPVEPQRRRPPLGFWLLLLGLLVPSCLFERALGLDDFDTSPQTPIGSLRDGAVLVDGSLPDGSRDTGPEVTAVDTGVPFGPTCTPARCSGVDTACRKRACLDDSCVLLNEPITQSCGDGMHCDGRGECMPDANGPDGTPTSHCENATTDDDETDRNCGGEDCAPCLQHRRCRLRRDCAEGLTCLAYPPGSDERFCVAPSCDNGAQDGDETGRDCGGSCLKPCALGEGCKLGVDGDGACETGYCAPSSTPTEVADGVCCGSRCAGPCRWCVPQSGICENVPDETEDPAGICDPEQSYSERGDACQVPEDGSEPRCWHCSDQARTANETGIDCGGGACPMCELGARCELGSRDCQSGICSEGQDGILRCASPRCNNGIVDGHESDVDCGGACGPLCGHDQTCHRKADCASGSCVAGKCVGP